MKEFLNKLIELSYQPERTVQEYCPIWKRFDRNTYSSIYSFIESLTNELSSKYIKDLLSENLLDFFILGQCRHDISNKDLRNQDVFYSVSNSVRNILNELKIKNNDNDFLDLIIKKINIYDDFSGYIVFSESLIRFVCGGKKENICFNITEFKIKNNQPYINLCYQIDNFQSPYKDYEFKSLDFTQGVSYNNGYRYLFEDFDFSIDGQFYNQDINPKDYQETPELNKEVLEHFELFKKFFLFLEYAPIENKESFIVIDKHSKVKLPKAKSKIKVPILNIDSTYYTNFRLNSKFNVNGHFRLQPYGKERQLKKIIWINEFKKSGYVRQAKILTSV